MNPTRIKAGYRVSVESWENDADNFHTETQDGLTRDEVVFVKALLYPVSISKGRDRNFFGNMYDDCGSIGLSDAFYEIVEKHKEIAPETIRESFSEYDPESDDEDAAERFLESCMSVLTNYGVSGGDYFTRVASTFRVEWVPEEILIENVTDQF